MPPEHPSSSEQLEIAIAAAEEARLELGAVAGQLQVARDEWGASSLAQAEWNERFDLLLQQLAASTERERQLTERVRAFERSTSWRAVQFGLGPYRRLRRVIAIRRAPNDGRR